MLIATIDWPQDTRQQRHAATAYRHARFLEKHFDIVSSFVATVMAIDGLLIANPRPFEELMEKCGDLAERANEAR